MARPVRMPKPGQMTAECTIVRWYKAEGDPVRRGDALFEIETDKATMDVEAFDDGVLLGRLFGEGDTIPVNAICAYIGEPGEAIPSESAPQLPVVSPAPVQPAPSVAPSPALAASMPTPLPSAPAAQPPPLGGGLGSAPAPSPPAAPAPGQFVASGGARPRGTVVSATPSAGAVGGVSPRAARL
ncbi:MAG: dihydrolipoamide acetyltransferase, partial [Chloroflexota bacterium]